MKKLPLHPALIAIPVGLSLCIFSLIFLTEPYNQLYVNSIIAALPLTIVAYPILQLIFLYKMWQLVQDSTLKIKKPSPGKAIAYLFIPIFNLYWIFILWRNLALHINHLESSKKIPVKLVTIGCAFLLLPTFTIVVGLIILLVTNFYFYKAAREMVAGKAMQPTGEERAPAANLVEEKHVELPPEAYSGQEKVPVSAKAALQMKRLNMEIEERKFNLSRLGRLEKVGVFIGPLILAASIGVSAFIFMNQWDRETEQLINMEGRQRDDTIADLMTKLDSHKVNERAYATKTIIKYEEAIPLLIEVISTPGETDSKAVKAAKKSLVDMRYDPLKQLVTALELLKQEIINEVFPDLEPEKRRVLPLCTVLCYEPLNDFTSGRAVSAELKSLPRQEVEQIRNGANKNITYSNGRLFCTGSMTLDDRKELLRLSTHEAYREKVELLFKRSNMLAPFSSIISEQPEWQHNDIIEELEKVRKEKRNAYKNIVEVLGDILRERDKNSIKTIWLAGINLSGIDLSGIDLHYATLTDVDLRDTNLSGANLQYTTLINADLRGANLSGADIRGADLDGVSLHGSSSKKRIVSSALQATKGARKMVASQIGEEAYDYITVLVGRDTSKPADYKNGAKLSGADLRDVKNLSENNQKYASAEGALLGANIDLKEPPPELSLGGNITYDTSKERLVIEGPLSEKEKEALLELSKDIEYKEQIEALYTK